MYYFFHTERSVVCSSIIWFSANRLWQLVWFQHQCGFPIFITTISLRLVWITLLEAGCLLSGSIIENWLLLRKSSLLTRYMFRVSLSDAQFFLVCPTCLCFFFFVCFPLKYIQYQLFLCSICHLSENGFDYKTNRFVSSSSRVLELCFLVVFCH